MNEYCPFRHDIECDDCVLNMLVDESHNSYTACVFAEIAERLKQIARKLNNE